MSRRYIQNCTGGENAIAKTSQTNKLAMRIIFYVLTLAFVAVLLYLLFFSAQMQINNITVTGTQELSSQEIEQKVEQSLQGKYLKVIPKNNFLFVSQGSIENFIKNDYKKVRSVTVTKKFPDAVAVNVDERKGLLVWCRGDNDCFLLDENGIAYSNADFNSPELVQNHLLQITDAGAANVTIGDKVMDESYEKYLLAIKGGMKNLGLEINDQYSTPSRMAQEIQVKTVQGFDITFSTQFELESAIKTLAIILKKEIPANQLSNLAYIDLRSENKVFYKLNNQQAAVSNQ